MNEMRADGLQVDLAGERAQRGRDERRASEFDLRRVAVPQAPLRRSPSPDAILLTEALRGELLIVLETDNSGWARVQLQTDSYIGWTPRDALAQVSGAPTRKVSARRTLVFSGPSIKQPTIATLPMGAQVEVTGEAEDANARYALIAPAGAIVQQHLASLDAVESNWTSVAERFLGVPYLWGGKTDLGIDCSGLVQVALQACGINAPRDSGPQVSTLGIELPIADGWPELRRGDLVFWRGHVGIMRDAETLLHANAFHMAVAVEPLRQAAERMASRGANVTSIRRIGRE
jgi:cell wall-associated NlpC family hydrolase